jgi:hypothetical protein
MKSSKIAKYARMASDEAHEEYMAMNYNFHNMGYTKDLLSEMIDKFDNIERMANKKWWKK